MSEELVNRFIHKYSRLPTETDPDYLEMLRMSKYRVLARPDVGPHAKCANCGSAKEDERMYVDFGLTVDWYGPVYLCGFCIRDIGGALKIFRAYEIQILKLEEELAEMKLQRVSATELKQTFLKTYEEVKTYFDNLPASIVDSNSNRTPGVGPDKEESNSGDSGEDNSGSKKPELRASKPVAKSGSSDIPSLTNLLST